MSRYLAALRPLVLVAAALGAVATFAETPSQPEAAAYFISPANGATAVSYTHLTLPTSDLV